MGRIRLADWGRLKSEFVWAYEGEVETVFSNSPHHHPGQSALLILAGGLEVETDAGRVRAGEGQWVFPSAGLRLQRFKEGTRVLSVHFHLYWPGGQPLFDWPVGFVFDESTHPAMARETRRLIRLVNREMPGVAKALPWTEADALTHFRFQRSFDAWLFVYVETMTKAGVMPSRLGKIDPRVLRAVTLLDEAPLDVLLDEPQLHAESGLCASQFNRLFSRQFKLTPHQYFENRRLVRAQDLIRSAPLAIKQVAYEVGFVSLPSFSRWFRQKTGLSPREFQKQERG